MGQRVSQNKRILKHLTEIGPITQAQATELYGVERLGARIFDLRHYYNADIIMKKETGKNRFGDLCCFGKYYLKGIRNENSSL